MYTKKQVIEFANYCISNIASDKSLESIFDKWDAESSYKKTRNHFLFYLSKLKSPYAAQAIENYNDEFSSGIDINSVKDVQEALTCAFDWEKSSDGRMYWFEIYHNINKYLK
jgi:hypothetical protein